jgi:hypothetical protein
MPGYSLDVVGDTLIRGIVVAGNNVGAVRSKVLGLQALNARPNYPSCNTAPAPYKCDTDADAADCGDDQTFGAPSTLTTNTYTCYDAYAPDNGVPNDGNSYNVYSIVKTVSSPLATFNPTTDKITFGGFTTTKHFAVTENLFLHQSAIGRP